MKPTAVWPPPNAGAPGAEQKLGLKVFFTLKCFHCEEMFLFFFSSVALNDKFLRNFQGKIGESVSGCVRGAYECVLAWWLKLL